MRRQWAGILTLAVPGVAITALIVAGALSIVRVPFGPALLTGAILSATDPIAVVAVFRRIPVPRMLRTLVECESLFNDAIAVVLYRAILLVVLTSGATAMEVGRVTLWALTGSALGIGLGIVIAFLAAALLRGRRNVGLQIVTTALCAYGSYFVADALHGSGIFATISTGIALRYFERRYVSVRLAADVEGVWDIAALVANAVVFFLIGAALSVVAIGRDAVFVVAVLAGVALARGAVSALLLPGGYPREWLDVVRVAGMRGALSLALALALPPQIPYRDAIVAATFAVALATIVSSTVTVPVAVTRAAVRKRDR
jgi:CPA1 family monovalent cation:H+ antiporter